MIVHNKNDNIDNSSILLSEFKYNEDYYIKEIRLQHSVLYTNPLHGDYSYFTIIADTNKGKIVLKFDEGYRGKGYCAFTDMVNFIKNYLGLSSIINRIIIEFES